MLAVRRSLTPRKRRGIFMYEHAPKHGEGQIIDPELAEARLLGDVDNLLVQLNLHGRLVERVLQDDIQNKATALCEAAIPAAVTTTHHRIEYRQDETGRQGRVITWLGKTAIELAESGYEFHFSPEARERVDIEVREAADAQENLRPGIAKVFISPKMSIVDASTAIARAEHLHEDDSLRVSYVITDAKGEVIGRKMQSLLVRDIPLSAWTAMLADEANVFGRSFTVRDKESALSVMELFDQLDLPEARLPEGPVTLVEAVLPYIQDVGARESVRHQLEAFRGDQSFYAEQARSKAEEWSSFDIELARSLKSGKASHEVRRRIASFQHDWNEEALEVIQRHEVGDTEYLMTRELAGVLERSIRRELEGRIAVVTGNERAISAVTEAIRMKIVEQDSEFDLMRANGASAEQIHAAQMNLARVVVRQNIRTGGGCAGSTTNMFGTKDGDLAAPGSEYISGVGEQASPYKESSGEDKSNWKWKKGVCAVEKCSSRPGQTEVGPCSVCRHCQAEFDAGRDPTKGTISRAAPKVKKAAGSLTLRGIMFSENAKKQAA